ncbi:MAG: hypothetical protein IID43_01775 [Planctomycetes bacterium]|nr:hypothetical protein [Planctomycetota bacterium]
MFDADYYAVGNTHAASFLDMIDVLVAGQFRKFGVTMRVVRAAYSHLQDRLKTKHPFCHEELYTDGKEIIIRAADAVGDSVLSEAVSGQRLFMQVLEYLARIDFSHATKLAERWRIAEGVVIDPKISLGKPVVESTGKTTFVIANCYVANDKDAGLVAELFDVEESDVLNAFSFEQQLRRQHAA